MKSTHAQGKLRNSGRDMLLQTQSVTFAVRALSQLFAADVYMSNASPRCPDMGVTSGSAGKNTNYAL